MDIYIFLFVFVYEVKELLFLFVHNILMYENLNEHGCNNNSDNNNNRE